MYYKEGAAVCDSSSAISRPPHLHVYSFCPPHRLPYSPLFSCQHLATSLVVFAAVAHRSHHQTNVVLPTQQQQTHCQTPTSSTSTSTYLLPQQKQLNRNRETERAISLSWLLSRGIELVLRYQPTNEQHQSSSLLD